MKQNGFIIYFVFELLCYVMRFNFHLGGLSHRFFDVVYTYRM